MRNKLCISKIKIFFECQKNSGTPKKIKPNYSLLTKVFEAVIISLHWSIHAYRNDKLKMPSIEMLTKTKPSTKPAYPAFPPILHDRISVSLDFGSFSSEAKASAPHVLFSPLHYEPNYSYPLLVWLHGSESDERQLLRIMPNVSLRNYVAIAPQGIAISSKNPRYGWPNTAKSVSESEDRVFACLDIAKEKCNVSSRHIYLAGFGTGGTMALQLATMFPDVFSGVISLCGGFPSGAFSLRHWNETKNTQFMFAVGQQSLEFSPEQASSDLKLLHAAGLSVSLRQYPCAQEISTQMLQDVNRWIMERVCDK